MLRVILRVAPPAAAAALGFGAVLAGTAIGEEGSDKSKSKAAEQVLLGTGELTSGIPGEGPLTLPEVQAWLDDPRNHVVIEPILPLGMSGAQRQIQGLEKNPLTRAKIELGRQLYFDSRLSLNNSISCASCHHPDEGFAARTQFGVGIEGKEGNRNSPASYNRIASGAQFWDGRAASLEEQAKGPIANPIEMGNTHEVCCTTIGEIPTYRVQFERIFADGVTIDNIAEAIAAFERVLVTGPSPFDYYEALQQFQKLPEDVLAELEDIDPEAYARYEEAKQGLKANPMSESAIRGRELFFSERVGCSACHAGANLSDELYHNIGVGMDQKDPDLGRYLVTKEEKDKGAFKTPTIRNVALTAPYMHDGSQATLEEVVEHYAKGGIPNKWLSDKIRKIDLTDQEKKDLIEFMKACTGPFPPVETERLPE